LIDRRQNHLGFDCLSFPVHIQGKVFSFAIELPRFESDAGAEQARVAVRKVRQHGIEALRKLEKDSEISQDEQRKLQNDIQHLTDNHIKRIDETLSQKDKEILQI